MLQPFNRFGLGYETGCCWVCWTSDDPFNDLTSCAIRSTILNSTRFPFALNTHIQYKTDKLSNQIAASEHFQQNIYNMHIVFRWRASPKPPAWRHLNVKSYKNDKKSMTARWFMILESESNGIFNLVIVCVKNLLGWKIYEYKISLLFKFDSINQVHFRFSTANVKIPFTHVIYCSQIYSWRKCVCILNWVCQFVRESPFIY